MKNRYSIIAGCALGMVCLCANADGERNLRKEIQPREANKLEIVQVTTGVKFFKDGDMIAITEVRATSPDMKAGDRVIVRGRYALASAPKASLLLSATDREGPGRGAIRPGQRILVAQGQDEFELAVTLEYDGYLHVTFYAVPEGQPFGGLYFGTAKQIEAIRDWDVRSWYSNAP